MMRRILIFSAALSVSACALTAPDTAIGELSNARTAIALSKAAGAEQCAPELQAKAVASLYWAAHEFSEGEYHPEENAELAAAAESNAKAALAKTKTACKPEIIQLNGVTFSSDSAELTPESLAILDQAIATLKRRADIKVEIAAHTDSTATDAHNLDLSNRRASSVQNYLESHGIDSRRLSAVGYGEAQPIDSNETEEGKARNRRVELRVK